MFHWWKISYKFYIYYDSIYVIFIYFFSFTYLFPVLLFLNYLSVTLSHLLTRQTLRILLNKKITGFSPLKPKQHWDLMLKMAFRRNLLYFASLVKFMDVLYLDSGFQILFLSFYYLYCCYCCFFGVVVVSGFVIFYVVYYYYIFITFLLC